MGSWSGLVSGNINVLFVDDDAEILNSLKRVVRNMELGVFTANSGEQALEVLEQDNIDIMVTDKNMPGMSGNELLAIVAERWPETIRMMLTAYTELDDLMDAVNQGRIWGYMQKPVSNSALRISLEQAIQTKNLLAERSLLRRTLEQVNSIRKRSFQGFVGDSTVMQFVYNAIEQCAPSQASVFVTGQSGTGKELVAEAIHSLSNRKNGPFICLNCAAIPSELMESEIFGHVKGAFSGAVSNRDGAATMADGGTLFLDEIGEMDMALQSKILRFIQSSTFQKVGSGKTEKVDVRFICATNRDPMQAIEEKLLREDLYYRLNVISIDLPPLAKRDNDPLLIAENFLARFSELEEKIFVGFSEQAQRLICQYDWPGNVRQLQNVIHSSVVMSEGPLVTEVTLSQTMKLQPGELESILARSKSFTPSGTNAPSPTNQAALASATDVATSPDAIRPLAEVEKVTIENAIRVCDDNVVKAASLLEVSPSTLYRKIQQWENKPD